MRNEKSVIVHALMVYMCYLSNEIKAYENKTSERSALEIALFKDHLNLAPHLIHKYSKK